MTGSDITLAREPLLALLLAAGAAFAGCSFVADDDVPDADGDGHWSVADGGDDCDDGDSSTYPDAHEVCDDEDNDCDGEIDETTATSSCGTGSLLTLAEADLTLTGLSDDRYLGGAQAGAGDVDGDGRLDLLIGATARQAGTDTVDSDLYLLLGSGRLLNSLATPSLALADLEIGTMDDSLDIKGTEPGDLDGDGYDDLAIGTASLRSEAGHTCAGAIWLLLGGGGLLTRTSLEDADVSWVGEDDFHYAGRGYSGLADVDGDGLPELAVGAPGDDTGASSAGAVYLLRGATALAGSPAVRSLDEADLKLIGETETATAGSAILDGGDVDGDGLPDLIISAPYDETAGNDAGVVYVMLGDGTISGASGVESLADADLILLGASANDHTGTGIAGLGDLDADGLADLAVSAPRQGTGTAYSGAVYVWRGGGALWGASLLESEDADLRLSGEGDDTEAGITIAGGEDLNGDGGPDLVVGANGWSSGGQYAGATYVLLSDGALHEASGHKSLRASDVRVRGVSANDFAYNVNVTRDVNANGYAELLVGARGVDGVELNVGAVYLLDGEGL